jgi:hypothetical protein
MRNGGSYLHSNGSPILRAVERSLLHETSSVWKHLFTDRQRFQRIEWSVDGASNACGGFKRLAVSAMPTTTAGA